MPLPKELTTITPLSKYLAMFLFIVLPILGFYMGREYQSNLDAITQPYMQQINYQPVPITQTNDSSIYPTVSASPITTQIDTANWKTYADTANRYSLKYPSDWQLVAPNSWNPGTLMLKNPDYIETSATLHMGVEIILSITQTNSTTVKEEYNAELESDPNQLVNYKELQIF